MNNQNRSELQFSTLIVQINNITDDVIYYISKTNVEGRVFPHRIPYTSAFPFDRLKVGYWYALICVKLNGTWFWIVGFCLSTDDEAVLQDEELTKEFICAQ